MYTKTIWRQGDSITSDRLNNMESGIESIDSQIRNTPKRTLIENGKLYLVDSNGAKIDSGTTLPTGGGSNSGSGVTMNQLENRLGGLSFLSVTKNQYDNILKGESIIVNGSSHYYDANTVL